ncbi:hypothetical protein [Microvirga arsenatis]|uniref:Ead/Ea22-like family protein n=1 Tax=Microvirga arsenatis TaxID=2692265 RepID=A0ABW9YX41_9HYPH|nr:hypothetical protein [Microvirga arsenatis]NBJ13301.1 hypothetical protein [Microvirga arsenatis]NBJ24085.1 hypothetical protein [Microvirga arsenatis]
MSTTENTAKMRAESPKDVNPNVSQGEHAELVGHTPGPWKFEDWDGYTLCVYAPWSDTVTPNASGYGDYRGIYICKIEHQNSNECVSKAQAVANARLIAAAPTLLAERAAFAERVKELEAARDEARDIVALANNSVFGSWGYFTEASGKTLAEAIEDLKAYVRENATLRSENETLKREREEWRRRYHTDGVCEISAVNPNVASYMDHWERRALAAEARLEAMQKALEPFADVSGEGDEDFPDDTKVIVQFGRTTHCALTLGDFRRAALTGAGHE